MGDFEIDITVKICKLSSKKSLHQVLWNYTSLSVLKWLQLLRSKKYEKAIRERDESYKFLSWSRGGMCVPVDYYTDEKQQWMKISFSFIALMIPLLKDSFSSK